MEADLLPIARRFGSWVFLWMGLLQGFVVLALLATALSLLFAHRFQAVFDFWSINYWFSAVSDLAPLLVAIGTANVVMAIAGMPFGRWAGKAIGIRRQNIAWIGIMTAVVPTVLASLVFVLITLELKPRYFSWSVNSISADFLLPIFVFSLLFYLPSLMISLLSCLVIRQKMRGKEEELRIAKERNALVESATMSQ